MTVRKAGCWNLCHCCWAIESDGKAIFILSNIITFIREKWKCFQERFSHIYTNSKSQICVCCPRSVKSKTFSPNTFMKRVTQIPYIFWGFCMKTIFWKCKFFYSGNTKHSSSCKVQLIPIQSVPFSPGRKLPLPSARRAFLPKGGFED